MTTKACTKCNCLYPATPEYFSRNKQARDGLRRWCKQCANHAARTYHAKNRERRIEKMQQWRKENRTEWLHRRRQHYAETRPLELARVKTYRKAHPEKTRAQYQRWSLKNPEKKKDNYRKWCKANPEKLRANAHRRRALKLSSEASPVPFDEVTQLKRQKHRCYYCGCKLDKYHIDHVIPLSRGGSDHPDNKVLACPSCNLSKGAKLPSEWVQGGRLL